MKLSRKKKKLLWLSVMYRLQKLLPLGKKARLKFFLNMEWFFERITHEQSFKVYTPSEHPVRQCTKGFLLENINENSTVLDLGSDLGHISDTIAQKAKKVVGIDYNKAAIEIAKERYKRDNLEFHNMEAHEYLQEGHKEFDILILSHILEHLDNPKEFLFTFKDYFKQIYIELPDFDRNYLNHYRKELNLQLVYTDDDHVSEFDRDELNALLKECNIEIFKAEYRYGLQKLWCKVNKSAIQ